MKVKAFTSLLSKTVTSSALQVLGMIPTVNLPSDITKEIAQYFPGVKDLLKLRQISKTYRDQFDQTIVTPDILFEIMGKI